MKPQPLPTLQVSRADLHALLVRLRFGFGRRRGGDEKRRAQGQATEQTLSDHRISSPLHGRDGSVAAESRLDHVASDG